jgi:hypothetical protein
MSSLDAEMRGGEKRRSFDWVDLGRNTQQGSPSLRMTKRELSLAV